MDRHKLVREGVTTRYWIGGADAGPVVVFLHGATLDHHAWVPQVEALQSRFRVVAPDLHGHGESTHLGRSRSRPPSTTSSHCSTSWTSNASLWSA